MTAIPEGLAASEQQIDPHHCLKLILAETAKRDGKPEGWIEEQVETVIQLSKDIKHTKFKLLQGKEFDKRYLNSMYEERLVDQLQELLSHLQIPSHKESSFGWLAMRRNPFRVKWAKHHVLRIDPNELNEQFPLISRIFEKAKIQKKK